MDYVIVPFGYDRVSWNALVAYINTLGTIKMEFGYHFSPIYFLNKYDRRKGTSQSMNTGKHSTGISPRQVHWLHPCSTGLKCRGSIRWS
jgi:hypothetical protein